MASDMIFANYMYEYLGFIAATCPSLEDVMVAVSYGKQLSEM